jgi:protein-disulfide isomerase
MVGVQRFEAMKAAVDEALGGGPQNADSLTTTAGSLAGPIQRVEIGKSPVRGSAETVTIVEFSDYQCPFCSRAVPTMKALLAQYPQGIRWVFKNLPLDFHQYSLLAHKAALAAGEQGRFWEMHDLIFADQAAIKREDLLKNAMELGLDVNKFTADLDSERIAKVIDEDKTEAAALGVTGTPTFFVNGKRMIGAWPLAEYKKLVEAEISKAGATSKPLHSKADGNLSKGPSNAPVTLTWYADLVSPLTARANGLVSQLLAQHPKNLRVAFKSFPMEFHAQAMLAHEAALDAGAQGKFWEMLDAILSDQTDLTRDDLVRRAVRLGLDRQKFVFALDQHLYRDAINADMAEAKQQGVRGVPAFFVNSKRIDGIPTFAVLNQIVEEQLKGIQLSAQGQ